MPDLASWRRNANLSTLGSVAVVIGVFAVLSLVFPSGKYTSLLSFVALFAMVAYSVALPFRYAGILMIAQGAVWAVGAYTAAVLVSDYGWSMWAVLPVAAVVCALTGVVIGLLALRSRGHYFLIVVFAINELIVFAISQTQWLGGVSGTLLIARPDDLLGLSFDSPEKRLWLYVAFMILAMVVFLYVGRTKFGRRLIAVRDNEPLARAVGINSLRVRLQALALSGAMAGVAGVFYAYHQRAFGPGLFSAVIFLQVVLMVIIGGTRSGVGPFVGALILVLLPDLLDFEPLTRQLLYGAILILVILFIPEGPVRAIGDLLARHRTTKRPGGDGPVGEILPVELASGDLHSRTQFAATTTRVPQ